MNVVIAHRLIPTNALIACHSLGQTLTVNGLLIMTPHKNTMFAFCATSFETAKLWAR
jgi:hypothetical protein